MKSLNYLCFKTPLIFVFILMFNVFSFAQSDEECFMCHEDPEMVMERNGKSVSIFVNQKVLQKSTHSSLSCIKCHKDANDPDFKHSEQLVRLKSVSCSTCHKEQGDQVKNDIHHRMKVGENAPDCKQCHGTHGVVKPKQVTDKFNNYCAQCHTNNVMASTFHVNKELDNSCMECHDQKNYGEELSHSVHPGISCTNCHGYVAANFDEHPEHPELASSADCYTCHAEIAEEHKESIHGISIAQGINEAAKCWDCHGSHHIHKTESDSSLVYPKNLVKTCGNCHDDPEFSKRFFSSVKQPGKMYSQSVHGKLVKQGRMDAASCVTCHGVHDIKNRVQDGSKISAINVPKTCNECHEKEVMEYENSIHWMAVKKGVREAPTCNDCHSEHSIKAINTVDKRLAMRRIQETTCLQCHQNMLLSGRYGLDNDNAGSYQDSYHGLAVMRGDVTAAMCVDCHGVHSILPKFHDKSTVNDKNILNTCKKCHTYASEVFSKSYAHSADINTESGFIQDLVKKVYFWMIIIVIGGMVLHNIMIYIHDLRAKLNKLHKKIRVPRFNSNEVVQHFILIISFSILAITGFQLKYPESWWSKGLTLFMDETVRQNVHRAAASVLVLLSVYHVIYLFVTARGRDILVSILPKISDVVLAVQNVAYYTGLRKKHPKFDNFNYIEKAEYWALIWGTLVMGATGFILWFPTIVGDWAPVWLIKVCEIVHFYEAILATLAIVVWHWFFVIYRPALRFTFIDGQMTIEYYKEEHKLKFMKIVVEWLEYKEGKRNEKQLGNYTKMFIKTLEKQDIDIESFIMQEIENDLDLKNFISEHSNS